MKYVEKNDTNEKTYSVEYDKEKLTELLDKVKDYSYTSIGNYTLFGDITRWPATDKIIKKRVISLFKNSKTKIIQPETIKHHTEDDNNYVSFNYLYTKIPDLYDYIDIIVNDKSLFKYTHLFSKMSEEKTGTLNMFYVANNRSQFLIEGLLNYANSPELTDHHSIYSNEEYDYEGLNKLYKETLECFKFNLIAVNEYLDKPEQVDVSKLILKKHD